MYKAVMTYLETGWLITTSLPIKLLFSSPPPPPPPPPPIKTTGSAQNAAVRKTILEMSHATVILYLSSNPALKTRKHLQTAGY